MASVAQISANRCNAQKSTGPRTPEGKAVVAQNAVRHGLLARAAVLHGEDWEEYTTFQEEMTNELYPDGVQEEELAERIVDLSWRLRRARRYQNAVFEALYDQYAGQAAEAEGRPEADGPGASDPVLGRMLLADFSGQRVLERVLLYERRIESSLSRARTELRVLRRQPQRAAHSGAASVDQRWDDSGGYSQASPGAGADSGPETADSAWAARNPACETKPISGGAGERSRAWNPPVPSFLNEIPRSAVPASAEPAYAVTTNGPETTRPACETKPISTLMPIGRSAFPGGREYETKPISEEVARVKCHVSSEQDQAASALSLPTSNVPPETRDEPCGGETRETNPVSTRRIKDGNGYRPYYRPRR